MRATFPSVYQWLLDRAKPERDLVRRASIRDNWWLHAWSRSTFRPALDSITRFIATGQVSKYRVFQWLDAAILPDDKLIAIASDDAFHLGVLSSEVHVQWSVASGGHLGVGNDPVYSKSTCFETFPFPHDDTGLTPELTTRIRALAEQLDAHRKTQQAAHPELTLTGMYNVLDKLRLAQPLNAKDKLIHTQGLVSVLKSLHDELDAAVLAAYGWQDLQSALTDHVHAEARAAAVETLLERLVALNARRAAEEAAGTVRWLRPEFQQRASAAQGRMDVDTGQADSADEAATPGAAAAPAPVARRPWPNGLAEQIKAVAEVLSSSPRALSLADLEARFAARGRWRERLPTILDTLEALGRARRLAAGPSTLPRWQAG